MIRSVAHIQTRTWHREHARRHKRAWWIMFTLVMSVVAFALAGSFAGVSWHALSESLLLSTERLAGGYAVGLVLGAGLALIIGATPFAEGLFPVFDVLQNVPSFALLPLFVVLMGYSNMMIVLFTATGVMWPILFAMLSAIRGAHSDLNDAATIFGATGLRRIPYYLAPLSFPAVLTGSIVGIAIGWESVIGAELIGGVAGIGSYIGSSGSVGVTPALLAGIVGILTVVFVVNRLIWAPLLASSKKYAE